MELKGENPMVPIWTIIFAVLKQKEVEDPTLSGSVLEESTRRPNGLGALDENGRIDAATISNASQDCATAKHKVARYIESSIEKPLDN